jgi:hypothetical protein
MPLSPHLRSVQQRNHLGGVESSSSASSTSSIYAGNRKPEVGKDGWSKTNEDIHDTVFFQISWKWFKSTKQIRWQWIILTFKKIPEIRANILEVKNAKSKKKKSHNLFLNFLTQSFEINFLQFQNSKSTQYSD